MSGRKLDALSDERQHQDQQASNSASAFLGGSRVEAGQVLEDVGLAVDGEDNRAGVTAILVCGARLAQDIVPSLGCAVVIGD